MWRARRSCGGRSAPGGSGIGYRFRSSRAPTTGWIARLLFDAELPPLTKKELADTLQLLEGLAIDNEETVQCEDVVEQDIVLQTLASMLRSELIPFHMTATVLLHKLQDYGIFYPNDPRWPADGARLTAHLWKSRQWLYELHIGYRYDRLKGQRLHHFCPIWDVPKACLDMWRPPQVAPIPANERRPFEEKWREEHWPAEGPAASPVAASVPESLTGESPVTLMTLAASASPSASPPAPSASDMAAGSYGRGDADDAGDADFHHRPSDRSAEASAAPSSVTAATPEPRIPTVSESVAAAMAANPERYPPPGWQDEPDEPLEEVDLSGDDVEEPPPHVKPKKKYVPKFPDPNSKMRDWYRDAEAYINGDLDL